jgi:hydroxyacylglutathione hydrolase
MNQIQRDLWETATESPFPGLTTHAYLLVRELGNVLFYNTGNTQEIEAMAQLGGVAYQFLSHQDEVGDSLMLIRERFGAKLGGHQRERDRFARMCTPDILFERREMYLGNIEVIPTPGHSPGSTCFLVRSPLGKRYLFTGDTLYHSDEGWRAGYLAGYSDPNLLSESLELLATLDPDLVLSSAFQGATGYQAMERGEWSAHVQRARANMQPIKT